MDLTPFHGPPAAPPEVPGFRLHVLLGFGAHGEVWHAEDLITGDEVALKIGRRREAEELRNAHAERYSDIGSGAGHETALLSRIEHPHIVRLRRVVALPEDELALVLDLAAGGSLAALVAARGALSPAEVVTMLVPIVAALEHLHGIGLTHGDVSPGNLLFTADGVPQIGDLGVARVLGERHEDAWSTPGFTDPGLLGALGEGPLPAELLRAADFWSLAACCWFALTGRPPEGELDAGELGEPDELRTLLARCLSPEPAERPGPAEFADRAWRAARPTPIRLSHRSGEASAPVLETLTTRRVPPAPAEDALPGSSWPFKDREPDRPSRGVAVVRRTVPVSRLLVLLAAVGVVGAVTAGMGWRLLYEPEAGAGGSTTGKSGPEVTTTAGEPAAEAGQRAELAQALTQIGRARAQAFEMVSQGRLERADVPGSPAERADLGLLERLRENGYCLEDLSYRIRRVEVRKIEGRTAQVAALVATSAHRQVRVGGGYAAGVPATEPAVMVFTLRAVGSPEEGAARWRVHDIRSER